MSTREEESTWTGRPDDAAGGGRRSQLTLRLHRRADPQDVRRDLPSDEPVHLAGIFLESGLRRVVDGLEQVDLDAGRASPSVIPDRLDRSSGVAGPWSSTHRVASRPSAS